MKNIPRNIRKIILPSAALVFAACAVLCPAAGSHEIASDRLELWYDRPAAVWTEALPIGNGRMGAMVFGGIPEERIQFNESTLWTGQPHEYQHEGAAKVLPVLRDLCNESRRLDLAAEELEARGQKSEAAGMRKSAAAKQKEAQEIGQREFMSIPLGQKAYQPFGDVRLSFPDQAGATDYRRNLDLDTATAGVTYRVGDTTFKRDAFATFPGNVIVWRITADKPGRVNFTARMDSPHKSSKSETRAGNRLALSGRVEDGGLKFEALMQITANGGRVTEEDGAIAVRGADSAMLVLAAATSFKKFCDIGADPAARAEATLKAVATRSHDQLLREHLADHQKLFRRVSLDLGRTEAAKLPTDRRVEGFAAGNDPALAALVFQSGRYLLIASSREGGQPANLQGIWAWKVGNPWNADFHTNINIQMYYWLAEQTNLAELHLPLFDLMDSLVAPGSRTAKVQYNANGWVVHHLTDAWGFTACADGVQGIWPMGAAWMARHPWEYYQYTGDTAFLKSRAWPLMKGAARFILDFLVEAPAGREDAGDVHLRRHDGHPNRSGPPLKLHRGI